MTSIGVNAGQLTVELAVVATLRMWLPMFVVAAARRYAAADTFGINSAEMEALLATYKLPFRPRGITVAKSFEDWPINALPHVQVLSPSWAPTGGSQGGRTIKYHAQAAALVGAQERDDTRLLRACYEDGILGVLMQKASLGGLAAGIDIIGGGAAEFTEVSGADEQTFQGSMTVFEVTLQNVIDGHNGPADSEPPADDENGVPRPWPADPTLAGDPEITLTPQPITP